MLYGLAHFPLATISLVGAFIGFGRYAFSFYVEASQLGSQEHKNCRSKGKHDLAYSLGTQQKRARNLNLGYWLGTHQGEVLDSVLSYLNYWYFNISK